MFVFNSKTMINRVFTTKEILNLVNADKNIKKELVLIENLTLSNVINKNTLNMKSDESCKEIYIFKIKLKEKKIPLEFIKCLDKAILLHTYFLFQFEDEFKEMCIYRYIESNSIKRGNIYETDWSKKILKELPFCMSIQEIYNNLIFNLVPLNPNDNETLDCFLHRFNEIQKIKKEIKALEQKAFKEVQPRKKFDIGREIQKKREKLKILGG